MEDFESYITPREAASRLNRTEDEIWRMLETGKLPALLRAELQTKDGSSLGFDYALLPPEGVARVLHQGGDDLILKWKYAFGNGVATCVSAKPEFIRILWEPRLLSDVLGFNGDPWQAAPVSHAKENQEQRQARRYQMCIDAGLKMPDNDYAQLPRGIVEIAKRENITRQSLAEDLKAHIRRLHGR